MPRTVLEHTEARPHESSVDRMVYYLTREIIPARPTGFTVDPRRLCEPAFTENEYLVSLRGFGSGFRELPNGRVLRRWLIRRRPLLDMQGMFVGGWQDPRSGLFDLDLTVSARGYPTARAFARLNRQKSIYHAASGETIWIERERNTLSSAAVDSAPIERGCAM